jgi:hypothetical protein
MGSVRLLLDFILRGTETFSCGIKQASSPEATPTAARVRVCGLSTDGRPAMPTPLHNQPGQAFPPSCASRESPSCFTHEPLQACQHRLVLVCCCLLVCRHRATPKPQSNPTAGARAQASSELQPPPTPSRGSIRRGWRGQEEEERHSPLAAAAVRGGTGAPSLRSLVRSIPSPPQLSSRAGCVKLTVPDDCAALIL